MSCSLLRERRSLRIAWAAATDDHNGILNNWYLLTMQVAEESAFRFPKSTQRQMACQTELYTKSTQIYVFMKYWMRLNLCLPVQTDQSWTCCLQEHYLRSISMVNIASLIWTCCLHHYCIDLCEVKKKAILINFHSLDPQFRNTVFLSSWHKEKCRTICLRTKQTTSK